MQRSTELKLRPLVVAVGMACTLPHFALAQQVESTLQEVEVIGTAEEMLKQAPGVSIISKEDLEKRPPANDLSEIIRTMPGVNLTGNSASGQYGNNRQIDLRGMGPENTLILIDGTPVSSRNSTRMGRSGERNTRGDSNWVPVEAVESIEVLRGPAAARYGSGAAGGVVNIITKKPTDKLTGSVTYYTNQPEDSDEQDTNRIGFNLAGPLSEKVSFRFYGNANKTDADALSLNQDYATGTTPPAGREGVRNRDANLLLRWDLTDNQVLEFNTGFSRQGNIYAGDRAVSTAGSATLNELANDGAETNTLYRRTSSLVHRGNWGEGRKSKLTLAYEGTDNRRLNEGLVGGSEGSINTTVATSTSELRNWMFNGEYNAPLQLGGLKQMMTFGFDVKQETLDDPWAMSNTVAALGLNSGRDTDSEAKSWALLVEDNIELTDKLILTPGLRFDQHDQFGSNWSPSLNASYQLRPAITLKGGIARAFKAPNLYQTNPNYIYRSSGNGCPLGYLNSQTPGYSGCNILGNADLEAETSVNKEVGIDYNRDGWGAGLTYFRNDYKNKVVADMPDQTPTLVNGTKLFQWMNAKEAVVRGFEGHFTMPILGKYGSRLKWINNFTYMIENKDRTTRQPLATVPEYTVNSSLDWQATDKLSVMVTATFYGDQEPRTRNANGSTTSGTETQVRDAYHLVGISAGYTFDRNLKGRVGISNLFDKRLYREANSSGAGAATYNEAGRAFYATVTASF
ncbi:FepA family TonB-dependent siderophore receptor [Propionivibrio limicola]|uniref:FepA family TonB-dependent siderophore receptor n=1 Tax=Propionivibrio limicola TaxID=167645 RepID=UPI0012922EFD|nr:FepA family TonB-dependent siderophore receptor [Propionivibrio limicola]